MSDRDKTFQSIDHFSPQMLKNQAAHMLGEAELWRKQADRATIMATNLEIMADRFKAKAKLKEEEEESWT